VKSRPWFAIAFLFAEASGAPRPALAQLSVNIPPFASAIKIQDQPVTITVSGTVRSAAAANGNEAWRLDLNADLSDLQRQITPILQAQLKQDNRCGERISVEKAALAPAAPAADLHADIHFEKWGCAKAFGKEIVKKLIAGNGSIEARLAPEIEGASAVRFRVEVTSVTADGELGEILRSGSFGDALQERIRKTIAEDLEKSARFSEPLPSSVREAVSLTSAKFADIGEGRLALGVAAEASLGREEARALLEALKGR
jgi:hypothetical protein